MDCFELIWWHLSETTGGNYAHLTAPTSSSLPEVRECFVMPAYDFYNTFIDLEDEDSYLISKNTFR